MKSHVSNPGLKRVIVVQKLTAGGALLWIRLGFRVNPTALVEGSTNNIRAFT